MNRPDLLLVVDSFPGRPALDTAAMSRAVLDRVARGELPALLRLHRPEPTVAFSKQDRASPGYGGAVAAAREQGFAAVERLPGGRAAVFHPGTLSFALAEPDDDAQLHIHERFRFVADLLTGALRSAGVDARIGEVPGEYCPGGWSVNARGQVKLAGIGQRIVSGAVHTGAVVVLEDSDLVRRALVPVYRALGLPFDPATAGAVGEEGADPEGVERHLLESLGATHRIDEGSLDEVTVALAERYEVEHLPQLPVRR